MSKSTEVVLLKTAMLAMMSTIMGAGIPGLRPMRQDQEWKYPPIVLYATWELAWSVEATLMVIGRHVDDNTSCEVSVRVNAPTCEKSVSSAIAFADLYSKVATLAALLDAQWGGQRLYLKAPNEATPTAIVEVSQVRHADLRCVVIPDSFPIDADVYVGKSRGRGLKAHVILAFKSNGLLNSEVNCTVSYVSSVVIGARVMVETGTGAGVWAKAVVIA